MKRVLVIKLDHIGDFALALPALKALADQLPPHSLDVVVSPFNLGWREVTPWLGRFFVAGFPVYVRDRLPGVTRRTAAVDLLKLAMAWRGVRYDAAIDMMEIETDWRGKLLTWLSGAQVRLGSPGAGSFWLTQTVRETEVHQSARQLQRLRELVPELQPVRSGLVDVTRQRPDLERSRVILHPGAAFAAKRWVRAHWLELARLLISRLPLVEVQWMAGPGERRELEQWNTLLPAPLSFAPSGSLRESLQSLADADLLVGLDSAAPHLASVVGTPTITIFSAANDPARWAATGDNTVLHHFIPCAPCQLAECSWETHRCMEAIEPERVFAAVQARLTATVRQPR